MNLTNLHLDGFSKQIKAFIETITGMPLQIVDSPEKWMLVIGSKDPISFGYNKHKRGNLDKKQLEYMTYVNMLQGIQSLLTTPDKFVQWKNRETTAKN